MKNVDVKKVEEKKDQGISTVEVLVEISRIHHENGGKMSVDEFKLRLKVSFDLGRWFLRNKLKYLQEFLSRLKRYFFKT